MLTAITIIIVALVCIVLLDLWLKIINFISLLSFRKWDKVQAKIIKSIPSRRIGTRGPHIALFQWNVFDVDYKYSYNGKEYAGRDIIDFKPKELKLHLYVNPQNPAETRAYK
jgi:hypothetical protein